MLFLAAIVLVSVITGALHYAGGSDVAVFALGVVALGGLAWVISFTTEEVGEHFGPAITGVLQSTLGNLPELFVVLFALSAGEVVVAQTSILGSLFANALLVLGATLFVGAHVAPDGPCASAPACPTTRPPCCCSPSSSSWCWGCPTRSATARAATRWRSRWSGPSCCWWSTGCGWSPTCGSDEDEPALEEPRAAGLPMPLALGLLAVGGLGAALVSEWFVDSIDTDRQGSSACRRRSSAW